MPTSIRVEVIDRDILFTPGFGLSPSERSAALAEFAAETIAEARNEAEDAFGSPPAVAVAVDGTLGKPLAAVKPDGMVVASFDLTTDLVAWAFAQVVAHSPKRKGAYAASHRIFADGTEVSTPEETAGAKFVVIAPTVPYARKIEGLRGKPESSQAPNGVYQVVAVMAASRFGNVARITFGYQEILASGSSLATWATGNSAKVVAKRIFKREGTREVADANRRASRLRKNQRQPTIVMDFG